MRKKAIAAIRARKRILFTQEPLERMDGQQDYMGRMVVSPGSVASRYLIGRTPGFAGAAVEV
jgi:hypothetical protein